MKIKCTCSMKKHQWRDHAVRCPVYVAGLAAAHAEEAKAEAADMKKRTPRNIEAGMQGRDVTFTVEANASTPHGFSGVMSVPEAKDLAKKLTLVLTTKRFLGILRGEIKPKGKR